MDIDMSIKSIGWVFALTIAGLLAIFYAFVSPEGLPSMQNCTLFASGLIVGESLIGVALAAIIVVSVTSGGSDSPLALVGSDIQPPSFKAKNRAAS